MKPLVWSEPAPPNNVEPYDHVIAQTPFGKITITWKSWKMRTSYDTETPTDWALGYDSHDSLERAKAAAQESYHALLRDACTADGGWT